MRCFFILFFVYFIPYDMDRYVSFRCKKKTKTTHKNTYIYVVR